MIPRPASLLILLLLIGGSSFAQDEDLLASVTDTSRKKEYVSASFKSSRVIMSHSMELLRPGMLDFRILHRFGNINQGVSQLFGLDQATIRLGLDYGITRNLMVGLGRSSNKKELDAFFKYRPVQQATGPGALPFSLLVVGGTTLQTLPWSDPEKDNKFSHRMAHFGQLIAGRKFSEAFTLQLMPTFVHRNLVPTRQDPNDLYAAGVAGRVKLSRRVSLNVDYYYVVNQTENSDLHHPLSVGFDIETGGHVFQLHFTNAAGMNERAFLAETTNDWGRGDIQFGFNISRGFQLKKKKGADRQP